MWVHVRLYFQALLSEALLSEALLSEAPSLKLLRGLCYLLCSAWQEYISYMLSHVLLVFVFVCVYVAAWGTVQSTNRHMQVLESWNSCPVLHWPPVHNIYVSLVRHSRTQVASIPSYW